MNNKTKLITIFINIFFILSVWGYFRFFENIFFVNVKIGEEIFHGFFLLLIIFLGIMNYFFEKEVNFYVGDILQIGVRGWLAAIIDCYFVFILNWKFMMTFFPVKDFVFAEMALVLIIYFNFSFYLFKRTVGMKIVGLWVCDGEGSLSKINFWRRGIFLGFLFYLFYFWIVGALMLIELVWTFWKREKTTLDIISKTCLVRKKP